jgi:hypothetical protein
MPWLRVLVRSFTCRPTPPLNYPPIRHPKKAAGPFVVKKRTKNMRIPNLIIISVVLGSSPVWASGHATSSNDAIARPLAHENDEGLRFACKASQVKAIEHDMAAYLTSLGIAPELVIKKTDLASGTLVYTLNTPKDDTDTLHLQDRPELQIREAVVNLPAKDGETRKVQTVSEKEILLAILQHGRLTEFSGEGCRVSALQENIGIRQNTVAWAEELTWHWPDGGPAEWNEKYWKRGTPQPGYPLHEAINDAFVNQDKYAIGCYTATKLVIVQGVLDYYRRISKDPVKLKQMEDRLYADGEPLVDIEPGRMWDFEEDFDLEKLKRAGKLVKIQYRVAAKNFIPGDWAYFLNPDPVSSQKTGYEGSSTIYLGRNLFVDYFNDHDYSYTFEEKLDELYQWRNGVFSRSRDHAKIKPLTRPELENLARTPAEGGVVLDFRAYP